MATNTVLQNPKQAQKLGAKDLINVGLFTAIYFVVFFATGMIGYIPVLMLVLPVICPLVCGVVFMLFLTRVNHFGMVTIMGVILSLLMLVTGHSWTAVPIGTVCALLGDFIMWTGRYRSWGRIRLGYIVFSMWFVGMLVPMFFMRESFFNDTRKGYGETYADTLSAITPPWVFWVMLVAIALGALAGAYLGRAMLKKHFKRAGIV